MSKQLKTTNKSLIVVSALMVAVLLSVFSTSCYAPSGKLMTYFDYFGTISEIAYFDEIGSEEKALSDAIQSALDEIDQAISLSIDSSDISRFNRAPAGERLEISKHTFNILTMARSIYEKTRGAFNPAAAYLIDLWGFSPAPSPLIPAELRRSALSLPNKAALDVFSSNLLSFDSISVSQSEGKYYVTKPADEITFMDKTYSMMINVGGIGKGYAADICNAILSDYNVTHCYSKIGVSSLSLGGNSSPSSTNNYWKVKLNSPRDGLDYVSVLSKNEGASTSGDYENYFMFEGKRYCHIINPDTGRPIESNLASVSVFGPSAAECDALSTALMVMGENGLSMLGPDYRDVKYILASVSDKIEIRTNFERNKIDIPSSVIIKNG